ncbi:hypothetical protein LTR73_007091, partial [Friedmanniomyces endolithicus]
LAAPSVQISRIATTCLSSLRLSRSSRSRSGSPRSMSICGGEMEEVLRPSLRMAS